MKTPTSIDGERSMGIRTRSKRGESINQEDHKFNMRIYKKYPEWYHATEARVFNEAVPFGSTMHIKEPEAPPYSD